MAIYRERLSYHFSEMPKVDNFRIRDHTGAIRTTYYERVACGGN